MRSAANKVNYRYLFRDIVVGFCEVDIEGKTLFVKHLSALDQVNLEVLEEQFFTKAKNRGLPTEQEALDRLEEEEMWAKGDEAEIERQKQYLKGVEDTRKQLYLKTELEINEKQLEEARNKLGELLFAKADLVGQTCEKYSRSRVNDHYILKSFFKDRDLSVAYYTDEEISELPLKELQVITQLYNLHVGLFTDQHIQDLTLQDFYAPYFPFCDNVMNFFNKPLFQLSSNQVKIIVFTRMFKNIFENYPKIPESIRKDSAKIIDYVNAQDKAKDVMSNLDKDGASTVMGATKEDYEYLGYQVNPKGKSLTDMLKEKGGKMNMQDLIETMT